MLDLLGVIRVIVDKPIPVEKLPLLGQERFWVAVSAIVTALMALFTRSLAKETRDAVKSYQAESEQRERHHSSGQQTKKTRARFFKRIRCRLRFRNQ